jgi:hypothetical protein
MKKQFFFLMVFTLMSVSMVWGQGAKPGSVPKPSSCTPDALHPVAGVPFTYKATVTPGGGTYEWWATKDPNFITAPGVTNMSTHLKSPTTTVPGTDLLTTSANYASGSTSDEVTITWSDAVLSTTKYQAAPGATPSPTFVAVHYIGTAAECADNFKVYELDPINAFTVDIKNIEDGAKTIMEYDVKDDQCPSGVSKATYVSGAMQYEYGVDTMFYEVVAANFTSYWVPTFTLTGNHAVQTYTVSYTYDAPSTWSASTVWSPVVSGTTQFLVDPTVTSTANGVSVYVRVIITNNNYEGLALRTIRMAADGQNSVGTWDIVNSATECTATTAADMHDYAEQDLKPRPTVPSTTTSPTAPNTQMVTGNEQN